MKFLPLFCIVVALAVSAAAEGEEKESFRNEIAFGFDHRQGNSDELGMKVEAKRVDPFGENELTTAGEFKYSEADDEKKTEKAKAKSVYRIPVNERLYLAMGVEWSYDDVADVNYRVIVGPPNLGYRFYSTERASVVGEVGGGYMWEDVGGVRNNAPVVQVAEKAELALSETAKIWQSVEYLPEIDGLDSYLLNAEAGVQSSINAHLALKLVAKNSFDSKPAKDRQRNDLETHAALVVLF